MSNILKIKKYKTVKEFPLAQSGSYFNRVPLFKGCAVTINTAFRSKSHQTSSKHSCLDFIFSLIPHFVHTLNWECFCVRVCSEGQIWRMQQMSTKQNFWKKTTHSFSLAQSCSDLKKILSVHVGVGFATTSSHQSRSKEMSSKRFFIQMFFI